MENNIPKEDLDYFKRLYNAYLPIAEQAYNINSNMKKVFDFNKLDIHLSSMIMVDGFKNKIEDFDKFFLSVNEDYINKCERYIEVKYNLRILEPFKMNSRVIKLLSFEPLVSAEVVATNIANQIPDLLQRGLYSTLKEDDYNFKKRILSNKKIEFPDLFSIDKKHSGRISMEYTESFNNLCRLINYFEEGHLELRSNFKHIDKYNLNTISPYEFTCFNKLDKIKLFMNGKTVLIFFDEKDAQEFNKMFTYELNK